MRRLVWNIGVLMVGCGGRPEVPPSCEAMCEAGARLYQDCLDDWGASWSDAGFESRADFVDGCRTWSWEMGLLEEDAVRSGMVRADGTVVEECRARRTSFTADEATCSTFTEIDWNQTPW